MRSDPTGYWSKALGFGARGPVNEESVAEVVSFFQQTNVARGNIAIAPAFLPENWEEVRSLHELNVSSTWVKLASPIAFAGRPGVSASTDFAVKQLGASDAATWGATWGLIVREGFQSELPLTPLLKAVLDNPAARVFGAWDEDRLIGAGAVNFVGHIACLTTGETLPSQRRRGVQAALIAARVRAAAEAGCTIVTAETASGGQAVASYRNFTRAGFAPQYERANWLWTA